MSRSHVIILLGVFLAATATGCRSERAGSMAETDADGVPPVPAHVELDGPGVERCIDDIVPSLMDGLGYEVIGSEASRAGCVVMLEAFAPPESVTSHVTSTAGNLGYASTGDVAAKGGRRLTYAEGDGLAISILMRGSGPVTLQHPDAESHLELHWYNPNRL